MSSALWALIIQGLLGAFDTIYFHEYRARLPHLSATSKELTLHALRDFIYATIFLTLPRLAWNGWWAGAFVVLLALEIIITMYDFVIEDTTRKAIGGVYPAERVTHAAMGIVYGIFLAQLFPIVRVWFGAPTALTLVPFQAPAAARYISTLMGLGVLASGVRDLVAALSFSNWHSCRKRDSSTRPLLRARSE